LEARAIRVLYKGILGMNLSALRTLRRPTVSVLMLALGPLIGNLSFAEDPTGHEIIARFIEVSGGAEVYSEIDNRVLDANLDFADHGMEGKLVEVYAPPNYRQVVEVDVYEPRVIEVKDDIVLTSNGESERVVAGGARREDIRRHAQLNPFLDWTPRSGKAEVAGLAKIGDDECYRVEISPLTGAPILAFFSKETGLLRRIDNREANMYRYFGDYRELDGILVPYKVRVDAGMMMSDLEILRLEHNVDLKKLDTVLSFHVKVLEE